MLLRIPFGISKKALSRGQMYISYGTDKIYLSVLIHTAMVSYILSSQVNQKLRFLSEENGFFFVDNDNICKHFLHKDGLHLLHYGKQY